MAAVIKSRVGMAGVLTDVARSSTRRRIWREGGNLPTESYERAARGKCCSLSAERLVFSSIWSWSVVVSDDARLTQDLVSPWRRPRLRRSLLGPRHIKK